MTYIHPCEAVLESGFTGTAWRQTPLEIRYGRVVRPAGGVWPRLYYNMSLDDLAKAYTIMFGGGESGSIFEFPAFLDGITQSPGEPLPEVAEELGLDLSLASVDGQVSPYQLLYTVMKFCPYFAAYISAKNDQVKSARAQKPATTPTNSKGDVPLSNAQNTDALLAALDGIQKQLNALREQITPTAPSSSTAASPAPAPSPVDPSTLAPGVGLPSGVGSGSHPFTPLDGLAAAPSTPPDGATPLEVAEYKFAKVYNALMRLRNAYRSDGKALMLINPDGSTVELSASPEFKECREALAQTGSGFNSGD